MPPMPVPYPPPPIPPYGGMTYPPQYRPPPPPTVAIPPPQPTPKLTTYETKAEDKCTTIYVGKIAPTVEDDFMRRLLEQCGQVVSWKRVQDPLSGGPGQFGFCEYFSADCVLRAMRLLSNLSLDGRELLIKVDEKTQKYLDKVAVAKREEKKRLGNVAVLEQKEESEKSKSDEAIKQIITQSILDRYKTKNLKFDFPSEFKLSAEEESILREELLSEGSLDKEKASLVSREIKNFRERQAQRDIERKEKQMRDTNEKEDHRDREKDRERRSREREKERIRIREERERERERESRRRTREERDFKEREKEWELRERERDKERERREKAERPFELEWDELDERMRRHRARERRREKDEDETDRLREREELHFQQMELEEAQRKSSASIIINNNNNNNNTTANTSSNSLSSMIINSSPQQPEVNNNQSQAPPPPQLYNPLVPDLLDGNPEADQSMEDDSQPDSPQDMTGDDGKKLGFELPAPTTIKKRLAPSSASLFSTTEEEPEFVPKKKRQLVTLEYPPELLAQMQNELLASGSPSHHDGRGSSPSAEHKLKTEEVKNVIASIPADVDELFAFTVNWDTVDQKLIVDRKMKMWVTKKIVEYLGEEEVELINFILEKISSHTPPSEITQQLKSVLDDESQVFVAKMWRKLIFEMLTAN
eukprot:TRINITY_DN724_c0_g1_i1.p1 TRINITY_DN724_c0_g1~~TRINITY_DN724_c0_g1_i1.p1  ORF type:complete len:695 (+),score=172.47 TRINITY_DN724_c0_g1_i1:120-2087(+)